MNDQDIIRQHILKVIADNDALRSKIAENDMELAELETAAKVIARLRGGNREGGKISADANATEVKQKKNQAKRSGLPTMPELIVMALRHEKRAMEPKEIADVIRRLWWPEVESQKIGSIVWRLNKRNDIEKVEGTSTYRLPETNEPSDEELGGYTSEGSLFNSDPEAQGVKAAPGGGP